MPIESDEERVGKVFLKKNERCVREREGYVGSFVFSLRKQNLISFSYLFLFDLLTNFEFWGRINIFG